MSAVASRRGAPRLARRAHLRSLALSCAFFCALSHVPAGRAEPSREDLDRFQALVKEAVVAYKAERFDEAIVLFEGALRIQPSSPIYWNLAVIYEKREDLDKALKYIDAFLLDFKQSEEKREQAFARREQLMARQQELRAAIEEERRRAAAAQVSREAERAHRERREELTRLASEPAPFKEPSPPTSPASPPTAPASRAWLAWTTSGVALVGVASGLHLYADSVWQSRPAGGGANTLSAQSKAVSVSWVADGLLALGASAVGYGLISLLSSPAATPSAPQALAPSSLRLSPSVGGLVLEGAF